jgi:GWxTD domain-containing protein
MKKNIIIIAFLILAPKSFAQKFNFDFDYARFKLNDSLSYIEFYYSFPQDELSIIQNNQNENIVEGNILIQIYDLKNENAVFNREFRVVNKIPQENSGKNLNLVGLIRVSIGAGNYKMKVTGTDNNQKTMSRSIEETFTIEDYRSNQIYFSDIQLASSILQESPNKSSIFYKNTLEVSPNPTAVFGKASPAAFYYLELYNLDKRENLNAPIIIVATLFNSKREKVFERKKTIRNNNPAIVEVGSINVMKYPSDIYLLVVTAQDSINKLTAHSAKKLYIYNPDFKDTIKKRNVGQDMASAEFAIMTEEECRDMLIKTKYIMSSAQVAQYNSLSTLEAKREFWFNFWKRLDPDQTTPINEYKEEYMKRVSISNEKFGSINKKGMLTDRGRVYIMYGEPDEIERFPSELDKKPYEIWHYNSIEGGVIFVFGDVTGFSNFELLHSTKRGELRDDNWMRKIQQQ